MKHAQKQYQHHASKTEEPEAQAADVRDEELAKETEDLLDEIACCLAEAVVTDEDKDLKAQARAEWDANEAARNALEITGKDYWWAKEAWAQKYRGVVTMETDCCGQLRPSWEE